MEDKIRKSFDEYLAAYGMLSDMIATVSDLISETEKLVEDFVEKGTPAMYGKNVSNELIDKVGVLLPELIAYQDEREERKKKLISENLEYERDMDFDDDCFTDNYRIDSLLSILAELNGAITGISSGSNNVAKTNKLTMIISHLDKALGNIEYLKKYYASNKEFSKSELTIFNRIYCALFTNKNAFEMELAQTEHENEMISDDIRPIIKHLQHVSPHLYKTLTDFNTCVARYKMLGDELELSAEYLTEKQAKIVGMMDKIETKIDNGEYDTPANRRLLPRIRKVKATVDEFNLFYVGLKSELNDICAILRQGILTLDKYNNTKQLNF
ncbi:MAG: hypothetical protein LBD35_05020 [Prevotellaceae bacterium]|nr:hypothetical protein [Prevotellaceae bacterium]